MISSPLKQRFLRSANELRSFLLHDTRYRTLSIEHAFVKWYLEARFGDLNDVTVTVTDGEGDGGIDAFVEGREEILVFQMKYEKVPRLSNVLRDEMAGFDKVAERLLQGSDQEFNDWLDSVNPNLVNKYKHLRKEVKSDRYRVRFIFATSKKAPETMSSVDGVEVEDFKYVLSLWELYQEGFTPPIESLSIDLSAQMNVDVRDRFTTYVGLADLQEFRRAMGQDRNERLFAQNVRTFLHSEVNESIRKTYETEPEKFWLGNNGIYIVCKDVMISGRTMRLTFPSIINGSQTLHSVNQSTKHHHCNILVRILKMDVQDDQKLLSEIIRRTNSQNAMNLVNLFAHDPYQFNVARYLFRSKIFYERREKEWQNEKKLILDSYTPVKIKDVAQWLSILHPEIGLGPARTNVAQLFEEANYNEIFGSFDKRFQSRRYEQLSLLTWSGLFVRFLIRQFGERNWSRAKIAHLLLTKLVFDAISLQPNAVDIYRRKLEGGEFGRKKIPIAIVRQFERVIRGLVRRQKTAQRSNEKLDFSNFFKRKDLPEAAYKLVCTRNIIKRLSANILSYKDLIY